MDRPKAQILLKDVTKSFQVKNLNSFSTFSDAWKNGIQDGVDKSHYKNAVNKVNLQIEHGQRVGIIGRNGAGKSTLLHLIAGVSSPSSGEVIVNGKVTSVLTLGVGLREDLSGRENIYIDGEIQGKSRDQIDLIINEIIEFAELGEFIDFPIRTYSTGMKARLAFSMITAIEPEILIIDEALSTGDAKFAFKATQKIKEICQKGKIVIIVSHGMGSIIEMCNRCIWMDSGSIVMDGAPEKVTRAYVDKIHNEDELLLKKKFKGLVEKVVSCSRVSIDNLSIVPVGDLSEKTIIETGKALEIFFRIDKRESLSNSICKLTVNRVDGLCLIDQKIDIDLSSIESAKKRDFKLTIESFFLGVGVYEISIVIISDHNIVAKRSNVLEVIVHSSQRGGRPAIIYPCRIEIVKTPENKREG